jgi:hypothetical protein
MDGARDINRRRLLAGLSGVAGCCDILSALGCRANGYKIDGEAFSLTQFPQIPLEPMKNDPPELVANFELPSGPGVKRRMSGDRISVSMTYGCENKPEGEGCACSTLSLGLDYSAGGRTNMTVGIGTLGWLLLSSGIVTIILTLLSGNDIWWRTGLCVLGLTVFYTRRNRGF